MLTCDPVLLECDDSSILKLGKVAGTDTLDTSLGSLEREREGEEGEGVRGVVDYLLFRSTSHTTPLLVAIVTNVPATSILTTS